VASVRKSIVRDSQLSAIEATLTEAEAVVAPLLIASWKEAGTIPTSVPVHGPGGLLSMPGLRTVKPKYKPKKVKAKSIDSVVADYDDNLSRFVHEGLTGDMTEVDFRRALKALVRTSAEDVYIEGMTDGGSPDTELSEDDQGIIDDWIADQVSHVDEFAAWIASRGGFTPESDAQAANRETFWVNSLRTLGGFGKASALGNPMCEWEFDPEIDKHCETCRELDGSSHRLKWYTDRGYIPQKPGAAMKCGGYYCGCRLRNKKTGDIIFPS
jgi:hypothetical protein